MITLSLVVCDREPKGSQPANATGRKGMAAMIRNRRGIPFIPSQCVRIPGKEANLVSLVLYTTETENKTEGLMKVPWVWSPARADIRSNGL